MSREIMVIGQDLERVMSLALGLPETPLITSMIEAARPLQRLLLPNAEPPDAAVVWLTEEDNVADMRELLRRCPQTRFVFLVHRYPPHAALARIIETSGNAVLSDAESDVVVAATLLALLLGSSSTSELANG